MKKNIIYKTEHDANFYGTRPVKPGTGFHLEYIKKGAPDNNLFFARNRKKGFEFFKMLQRGGVDKQSIFEDPLFVDLERGDVRLRSKSPAFRLGIESIDIRKIGLKNDPAYLRLKEQGFARFYGKKTVTVDADDL